MRLDQALSEFSFFNSTFKLKYSVFLYFCLFLSLSIIIFTQADCTLPAERVVLTKFIFFCKVAHRTGDTLYPTNLSMIHLGFCALIILLSRSLLLFIPSVTPAFVISVNSTRCNFSSGISLAR